MSTYGKASENVGGDNHFNALRIILFLVLIIFDPLADGKTLSSSLSNSLLDVHLNSLLNGVEFRGGDITASTKRRLEKYKNKSPEKDFEWPVPLVEPLEPSRHDEHANYLKARLNEMLLTDSEDEKETSRERRTSYNMRSGYLDDSDDKSYEEEEGSESITDGTDGTLDGTLDGTPLIYRYYGRRRARMTSDSVPFIFLGPDVNHWNIVGEMLSSRGFNAITCQRVIDNDETGVVNNGSMLEGHGIVNSILDALGWEKAIIVGCDADAISAIDAAMRLRPERVAGLVLCGDLSRAQTFVSEHADYYFSHRTSNFSSDHVLSQMVTCPCLVLWDGASSKWSKSWTTDKVDIQNYVRKVIVGGGSSPHRRIPEHFAWVLTRFLEENIVAGLKNDLQIESSEFEEFEEEEQIGKPENEILKSLYSFTLTKSSILKELSADIKSAASSLYTSGSLPVGGRMLAAVILYSSMVRIGFYQYRNFCFGITGVKSKSGLVLSLAGKSIRGIIRILGKDLSMKYCVIRGTKRRLSSIIRREVHTARTDSKTAKRSDDESCSDDKLDAEHKFEEDRSRLITLYGLDSVEA